MSDLIDRNDAVEAIEFKKVYITAYSGNSNGYVSEGNPLKQYNKGLDDAIKAVNNLAPAEPERKKGQWSSYKDEHCCSVCGCVIISDELRYDYCPYCGAEMSEGEW